MSKIRSIASNALLALFIVVLFLFAVFLLQNTSTIGVNFLMFDIQLPTIILILVAAIVGFLVGYLLAIRMHQSQKKLSNSNNQIIEQNNLNQERAN